MAKVKDLLVNGSSRFIGKIYASDQFISQVANGTAPFVVSSSTLVANLNADMTDGLHVHTGRNNEVNKIVRTDANGYIQTGYINTNVGTENLAISRIFYEYNNDGYIRKMAPSSFFSVLENSGNDISITVAGQNRKLTVGYASNSDKLDGYHASDLTKFYLSPMEGGAPASSAKSWFENTMPSGAGAIVYNVPGSEKTIIVGKSTGPYGHMLQLNYDDKYLRILRYYVGNWRSDDWEKISAGYADSAGDADKLDGYHANDFATAGHTHYIGDKPASDLSSTYPQGISVGGIYDNGYPFHYGSTITAYGSGGYFQIAGQWNSAVTGDSNYDFPTEMYIRGRRDSYDVWTTWTRVLTDRNYTNVLDNRYYTETEADNRFVNVTGDTMSGALTCNDTIKSTHYGPGFANDVDAGKWAYTRFKSGSNEWHIGTNSSAAYIGAGGAFEIRSIGASYSGISVRYNTSSYGKLVVSVPSGECSIGYYSNGAVRWTVGCSDGSNYGWYQGSNGGWKMTLNTSGYLTASGFIKSGSSDSYVLLGGGGHKALSDFSMAHSHPYLPTTQVSQEQASNDDWIKAHALSTLRGHVYNTHSLEWQYLFGISSGKTYGSILRTSYGNGTPRIQVMGLTNGTWSSWREVAYDDNTVKKDGTGASGTWGISITGNAATATKANSITTEQGTSNVYRNVFFAYGGDKTKVVYDDDFMYNPSTNTLKIGTGTLTASNYSGTATNANNLANIAAGNYFKHGDAVFNSEWSGKYLWTLWDNHLYAADKRLAVTLTGTTSTNFSSLFDGSFESSVSITEAKAVLHIKSTTEGNVWTEGLPYGDFYVVFYNSDAENITGRVYCNYAPQGTGWHDLAITHVGSYIWKLHNEYYQLSDLEITITKPVSSAFIDLCQVLHVVERSPSPYYAAVMSKYCDQKTNYSIESAKFVKTGGTSSQFLKADGSIDSNTYSKSNHTHSSVLDINDSNATTFAYSKSGLNYGDYTCLAGWNGYELRAVNKSQFAQASHTHTKSQITDFPTSLPANGGYANEIASKDMLDSQEKIDNFITPNRFEYALFKTNDANNVDFASNDGMILSIPWGSTTYGFQMAFDDTLYGTVKVRGKADTWGNWYTLLHSGNYTSYTVKNDGTGASGTWGINISGNAATATNANTLDGYHASYANSKPWGTIPVITDGGYMDVGKHFEFHYDNTTGSDYSTVLACTGNYSNIVRLPSKSGTLALLTDNVASASKWATPRIITLTGSVTGSVSIDGSQNVALATTTNHTHNYAGSSSAGGSANSALTLLTNNKFDTTYGNYAIFQTSTRISNFPHNGWFNSIKMLHNDSSGYFTEIAMSFTGEDGMWRRALRSGTQVGWYKMLDSGNYNSYALPISGGTLTGSVIMRGIDTNLIRDIVFDGTSGWARGLITLRVDGVDKFNIGAYGNYTVGASSNGIYYGYIGCNSYDGLNLRISATSLSWGDNSILHAGNYNSYCPKLDGTGATGTWEINISGNAATATNAENISSIYPQLAASSEADEINVKRKIDWNYWGDGGYQLEAAIDFNWYETHNLFGVLRGNNTDSAGFGWMYSPDGSTYTQIARLSPYGQLYLASSLTISGAISGVTDITASGHTKVNSLKTQYICIECDNSGNTAGRGGEINNYDGPLYLQYNTSNNCVICGGGGNVGIGTASHSYKLHVVGDIYTTTGFKKEGSSDSYVLLGGGGHKALSDFDIPASTTSSGITSLATGSYSSIHISTRFGGTMSFSSTPAYGKECHIIIYNSGSSTITITLPSGYRRNIDSITIASGAFGEVNVLNAAGTIYVRAV